MNKKIKVLHTFNIMNRGGAETLIMNIYRKIDREKIEFHFLCESKNEGNFDKEIYELGGKIFRISQLKNRPIKNMINLVKFMRENGPYDVIHIPNMFYSGIYCVVAKVAKVKKIIVHSHSAGDPKKNTWLRNIYRRIMRFLINVFSDIKISCGDDAAKYLFGTTKNVIMLNNGVDLELYDCNYEISEYKKEFNVNDEKVIANIARFVPEKNHRFFIKLGNYIKKENLKYKILLIGDGELKSAVEQEIIDNKLEKTIICTGLRTDIHQLLNLIDIVVMPSLHEGFPVTVVESIASGTPCVLSTNVDPKIAIIPELVSFVDLNDNCDVWINEIKRLLDYNIDRKKINNKLKELGFDINHSTQILEKIYLGNKEV